MYAVIETGGLQFEVAEGDVIKIPKLPQPPGEEIRFDKVLLIRGESDPLVGRPYVQQAAVEGVILAQGQDDKIIVAKYKRRTKSRRTAGHRQEYTQVKINRISAP